MLRDFSSPSPPLFLGLVRGDQLPGSVQGLSNHQSLYFSCSPGTGKAQGSERVESGAARGPRTVPGELPFLGQWQEPAPLTAAEVPTLQCPGSGTCSGSPDMRCSPR